jgi:hypothetical protein
LVALDGWTITSSASETTRHLTGHWTN